MDTFDAAMRLIESKDRKGNISNYTYTPYDQLEIAMEPAPLPGLPRPTTRYTYDPNNNITEVSEAIFDETGAARPPAVTQYNYDDLEEKMDRLKQVVRDANGLAATTAYEYDLNGRATKISTPEAVTGAQPGNVMHVKYDERDLVYRRGRGNLINEVPEEFMLFNYDAWGNVLNQVFQAGPPINYTYDFHGRLETMTDRMLTQTKYTRNKRGLVTEEIIGPPAAPLSTTVTEYDAIGRVENVKVNEDDVGTTFSYTPAGQLWKTEDPAHRITTTTFDTMHRPLQTKDAQGNTETYEYDANSNVTDIFRHEVNEAGDHEDTAASFDYDNLDRQIASTDIADNTTLLAYDSLNRLRRSTDARRNFCLYDYDNLGRQTGSAHYAQGQNPQSTQPLAATSQGYDLNGRLVSQTDPKSYTTFYRFDHLDRQDQVKYADGSSVTVLEFDLLNRPTSVRNQDGSVATNDYDEEGRLEERTVAAPNGVLAVHEQFQYDGLGRVVFEKAFGGPDTLETTTEYSIHDTAPDPFITKTISLPGVNISRTITTEYRHTGQPSEKTFTGGGHTLAYSYNEAGRPNGVSNGGTLLVATDYIGARRSRQTVGGQVRADYDYSPAASGYRVTEMTHQNANAQVDQRTNTWDDNYNRTGRNVDPGVPDAGAHNYSYDALDRMNPPSGATYSLDAVGNRTGGDYQFAGTGKLLHQYSGSPLGSLGYDAAGRLNLVSDSTAYSYKYDALGRLKELVLGEGATLEDMTELPQGSEQFPEDSWNDGGTLYADPGITARIHWPMNSEMRRFSFKYKSGIDPGNPGGPDNFDPRYYAQVIVRATRNPSTLEWTFLALVIQPDGIYLREWNEDAVTELGGVAVSITQDQWHDVTIELNGSRVSVRHLLFGSNESQSIEANTTILDGDSVGFGVSEEADFEFDDVTTDVPVAASTALRYHYDAYGRVVGRTLNPGLGNETSQFFIYDNDRIVQELDGGGNTVAEWVYGTYIDEPLVMYRGGETYYYLHDDLYNVIALAEADGDVVERYTYDDFGAPTVWTQTSPGIWAKYPNNTDTPVSSVGNPFMFSGRRWDEVLKLYDYRTRYYDPYLGRFLRIDTIGPWGDAANFGNPYTYVGNNPWSNLDPYGQWGWDADFIEYGAGGLLGFHGADVAGAAWSGAGEGATGGATIVADTFTFGQIDSLNAQAATYQGADYTASRFLAAGGREALIAAGTLGVGNVAVGGGRFAYAAGVAHKGILAAEAGTGGYQVGTGINSVAEGDYVGGGLDIAAGALRLGGVGLNVRGIGKVDDVARTPVATARISKTGRGIYGNPTVDRIAAEAQGAYSQANRMLEAGNTSTKWAKIYQGAKGNGGALENVARGNALHQIAETRLLKNRYVLEARKAGYVVKFNQGSALGLRGARGGLLRPDIQIGTPGGKWGVIDWTTSARTNKIFKYGNSKTPYLINITLD